MSDPAPFDLDASLRSLREKTVHGFSDADEAWMRIAVKERLAESMGLQAAFDDALKEWTLRTLKSSMPPMPGEDERVERRRKICRRLSLTGSTAFMIGLAATVVLALRPKLATSSHVVEMSPLQGEGADFTERRVAFLSSDEFRHAAAKAVPTMWDAQRLEAELKKGWRVVPLGGQRVRLEMTTLAGVDRGVLLSMEKFAVAELMRRSDHRQAPTWENDQRPWPIHSDNLPESVRFSDTTDRLLGGVSRLAAGGLLLLIVSLLTSPPRRRKAGNAVAATKGAPF